ncbi:uncharacterized protein RB166_020254 isoform 2-T2 [Leptodactylus fuscus]
MREDDIIFMSCPSFPHPSCPSSPDLSDFPSSFPVINVSSLSPHENASFVDKSDSSSSSSLHVSSMAPQDCSSTPKLTSSSMSSLHFPIKSEYSSSTSSQNSSSRSQTASSAVRCENPSYTRDFTDSKVTYSSTSDSEYSLSLHMNGSSTLQTISHSLPPANCSSTLQRASSSESPPKSCQPEYSSLSCQNPTSVRNCKSTSERNQYEWSSRPQMNGELSMSPLDSISCYATPTEDPSEFFPASIFNTSLLSGHGESSTSTLDCQSPNRHAVTIQECHSKSLSDNCSSLDFPCICTCESSTDVRLGTSSCHLNSYHHCDPPVKNGNPMSCSIDCSTLNLSGEPEHEVTYSLTSQNYLDLSNNINDIPNPQLNSTTHPCGKFTSTDHSTHVGPFTPWSTQNFQSPTFPETDVVPTNEDLSVDYLLVNGHYSPHLPIKSTSSCSLPSFIDSSDNSSDTPQAPASTYPNNTDRTVFANPHGKHPIIPSCSHVLSSGETPKYGPLPGEETTIQECEVCKASLENKVRMDQDRRLCEHFLDSLSRFEDWLQIAQKTTSQANLYKTLHQEAKLVLRKYEVLLTEIREKLLDLETLNRQYWRLTQTPQQTLLPSILRSRMQEVNTLWESLQDEAETLHKTLKSRVQQREEFETDQDDMKLCLTEMDLELSNVEYIYRGNSTEKIQQLKAFQEDVWSNMKRVEDLLERGDQLIDDSDPRDAADLEVEMTELGSYCQQIYTRLSRLQKRLVSTKLVFEDDFLDGAIEHLSSGSSDVFLDLDIEDEEVSSSVNVPFTSAALPIDLEWDPLGDVGRSSSHDGQESFYTATSAPWKLTQRSDGSRSSLSSSSGITYSNIRRHEVKEPAGDLHNGLTAPRDTYHVEWTEEQIHGQGQRENPSAMHNSLLCPDAGKGQDVISCSDPESEVTSCSEVIDSRSQPNCSGQRRRQRKKKRGAQNQDAKGTLKPTKPDVSILMENGDDLSHLDLHKTSYRPSCSLCLWIRRLAFVSVLFLVLVTSLLFPWGRQTCPYSRLSWSLMLTYVNGPPPT